MTQKRTRRPVCPYCHGQRMLAFDKPYEHEVECETCRRVFHESKVVWVDVNDLKDNPPEDEKRRHLAMLRSPKKWPIWPVLAMRNIDRDLMADNSLGVVLAFPHGTDPDTGRHTQHESKLPWFSRTVFTVNMLSLPEKSELVRLLMMPELVNFKDVPHETFKDFDAMYDAGWRVD